MLQTSTPTLLMNFSPVHYTPIAHHTTLASSFSTNNTTIWPEETCRARSVRGSFREVLDVFVNVSLRVLEYL